MLHLLAFAILLSALVDGGPGSERGNSSNPQTIRDPVPVYTTLKRNKRTVDEIMYPQPEYKDGNYIFGTRFSFHRLLYSTSFVKSMLPFWRVRKTLVVTDDVKKRGNIYYIEALDRTLEKVGGDITFIDGCMGCTFITLRFESHRWKGMHFDVNIYGR